MNFDQFQQRALSVALGSDVSRRTFSHGRHIVETAEGVFVDGEETCFLSLKEAQAFVENEVLQERVLTAVQQDLYEELSYGKVADIIRRYHNVKVTDTLIESYVELASSKMFTVDPVANDIHRFNSLDRLIEGHFDYVLDDGTRVVISEGVQGQLNNIFKNHPDVIQYMREDYNNFLDVINLLEG